MSNQTGISTKIWSEGLKKLYLNEETADVHFVFEVNGIKHRVPAHKNILASCSPVFYTMFYGLLKEKGDVKITDASPNGFMDFLAILYLGQVQITTENVAELTDLVNKYDIPEGLKVCEKFLLKNTAAVDLCKHLALAIKFNLKNVREHYKSEIRAKAIEVFKSEGFINCSYVLLHFILRLTKLNCDAIDVFNACMNWAKNDCEQNEFDATDQQNLRNTLGECFYLIPFAAMDVCTFSKIVFTHRLLFTSDEAFDLMAIITTGESSELSKKFIKCEVFDWDVNRLVKCIRRALHHTLIDSVEYTTFSVNKKMLFGGFNIFDYDWPRLPQEILQVTVSITRLNGTKDELLESHQFQSQGDVFAADIKLRNPVVIIPGIKYTICVDFSNNAVVNDRYIVYCYSGSLRPISPAVDDDIGLKFYRHPKSKFDANHSVVSQLYFNHYHT